MRLTENILYFSKHLTISLVILPKNVTQGTFVRLLLFILRKQKLKYSLEACSHFYVFGQKRTHSLLTEDTLCFLALWKETQQQQNGQHSADFWLWSD